MLVVMHSHASPEQVEQVLAAIRQMSLTPHPLPWAMRTAIGITGNISAVDPRSLEVLPGVLELIRVTKPSKLASREMHEADTYVRSPLTPDPSPPKRGRGEEEKKPPLRTAEFLRDQGVTLMRAGAFKPRTSPYAFQGLGQEGLDVLARARARTGIGIVTELMDTENADAGPDHAMSDGAQSLSFEGLTRLLADLRRLAGALGRQVN